MSARLRDWLGGRAAVAGVATAMTAVNLSRIDPARNMCRFYRLDVQPDLFGGFLAGVSPIFAPSGLSDPPAAAPRADDPPPRPSTEAFLERYFRPGCRAAELAPAQLVAPGDQMRARHSAESLRTPAKRMKSLTAFS